MKDNNKLNLNQKQWSKPSITTVTKESMTNRIRLSACSGFRKPCVRAFAR